MPPVETQQSEKPIQTKIGIIYPPPEVRNIVDKTASFVARNGPDFESRIRQNEINNPKFNFLNPADPYHAYYQHKVRDFAEGKAPEPASIKVSAPSAARLAQDAPRQIQETFIPKDPPAEFEFVYEPSSINALDIDVIKLTAQFVARNGRQFLTQLMNREQRNYQFDFLRAQHSMFGYFTKLVEQYTKILIPPKDIQAKLSDELDQPGKLMEQVKYRADWHRYQERQRKREEEAAERERMAYAMIDWHDFVVVETVDFQPNEAGNFPLPTTPEEVGARVIAEERGELAQPSRPNAPPPPGSLGVVPTDLDEDEESDFEETEDVAESTLRKAEVEIEKLGINTHEVTEEPKPPIIAPPVERPPTVPEKAPSPPQPSPPSPPMIEPTGEDDMELSDDEDAVGGLSHLRSAPTHAGIPQRQLLPTTDQVIIRHDYDPKSAQQTKKDSVMLVSPFTGEKIPASQAPKHIRVGLLDPKWVEQRDREIREKKEQEQVFAGGNLIGSSLRQLAERRTDIFGVGVDETQIGKKLGEQDQTKPDKLIWDGHAASVDALTKRTFEAVTPLDHQELFEHQKQLEAAREKIGPQSTNVPPPAPNFPPPGMPQTNVALRPPGQPVPPGTMMMKSTMPPPPPPPNLMMMAPPPLPPSLFPPGMPPPPPGSTFMPPRPPVMPPPMPPPPPPPPSTNLDEPEAKRPRETS